MVQTRGRAAKKTETEEALKKKSASPAPRSTSSKTPKKGKEMEVKAPVASPVDNKTKRKNSPSSSKKSLSTTPASSKKERAKKTATPVEKVEDTSVCSPPKSLQPKAVQSSSQHDKHIEDNKFHYEFGGPLGAFGVITGLPLVIYALYFICNKDHCVENIFTEDWKAIINSVPPVNEWLNDICFAMCTGWFVFQYVLERILPGETAFGVVLANKTRLPYTMSGHLQFWISLVVLSFGCISLSGASPPTIESFGSFPLELIYDNYLALITASVFWSTVLSLYLYLSSFKKGALLAEGGQSGNPVYDFFIGRELNPRIGDFDLKVFCELRPGLIGWMVINLGMACKQYQNTGSVSLSMTAAILFQGFYVWDALYAERAILTTMDVTTDGFGFMLAFGDLAWVPFIYSLQCRYLVDYDPQLEVWQLAVIVFLQCLGYFIFRAANSQKDAFRRDPSDPAVAHLTYMPTKRGTKLITSGWWGLARKINYTGDWLMTLSWCLLCGFSSPVPYFQAIYFLVLLVHRAMRDDKMCQEKYGDDWKEYKRRVPYVFIPYII